MVLVYILLVIVADPPTMELGLASLLRAMWIAGTLPILVAWIPYSRLSPLHGALLGFAKRGKIMQSSSHVSVENFILNFFSFVSVSSVDFGFYVSVIPLLGQWTAELQVIIGSHR